MILFSKGKVSYHLKRKWGNWMYHIAIVDDDSMFYDAVVANAILDRILHHAHVITISGRSYRLKDHIKTES